MLARQHSSWLPSAEHPEPRRPCSGFPLGTWLDCDVVSGMESLVGFVLVAAVGNRLQRLGSKNVKYLKKIKNKKKRVGGQDATQATSAIFFNSVCLSLLENTSQIMVYKIIYHIHQFSVTLYTLMSSCILQKHGNVSQSKVFIHHCSVQLA